MDGPQYLTVDASVVADAGRSTAATAAAWQSWASQIRNQFALACQSVYAAGLADELARYALVRQPGFYRISADVSDLGTGTTAAADAVAAADVEAAQMLRQQTSMLRRPVNAQAAAH